jgi:hypothetical protein
MELLLVVHLSKYVYVEDQIRTCEILHQEKQMIVEQIPFYLLQEILYYRHDIRLLFRIYFVARVDLNGILLYVHRQWL